MSPAAAIPGSAATATIPAEIREEGSKAVRGYRAALSFESMLLKQMLSEALPETLAGKGSEGESEGGEGGSAFDYDPRMASLPETVAESVVSAGGLGLAKEMYGSFEGGR
jgi:hypothetical protein